MATTIDYSRASVQMKFLNRDITKGLAFRLVIVSFSIAIIVGGSFYVFILSPISNYTIKLIQDDVREATLDLYNVCFQSFSDLQRMGYSDNAKNVQIKKGYTLGLIDDLARNKSLYIFILEDGREIFRPEGFSPNYVPLIAKDLNTLDPKLVNHDKKSYYIGQENFPPWNWRFIILKDTEAYNSLASRVKLAYAITFITLFMGALLAIFYLDKSIRNPIMQIISSVNQGRKPNYTGVTEFEFLSDNLKKALESQEKESNLINEIYKIAASYRGDDFFDEVVISVAGIYNMPCLIAVMNKDNKSERVLAMFFKGKLSRGIDIQLSGTPCNNVFSEKTSVIIQRNVWKNFPKAKLLQEIKAETFIGIPILGREEEVIGVVNLFGEHRQFSESDLRVLKTITKLVAFEIEHINEEKEKLRLQKKVFHAKKIESIGVLAGGIAHDFNNLLTAIMGNLSMAKMHLKPEDKVFQFIENTAKASLRARGLTQQLLTFAKGGVPVTGTVAIDTIVNDSADFILSGSNVKAAFQIDDNLWPVDVDADQVSQVIQNLVKNGDQVMPKGGTITIELENVIVGDKSELELPEGRYVLISVADEGHGIPEDHLKIIFDPYFTTKQQGSGLGLAVAYSIIKNHGGIITVQSKLGKGTRFHVYLPASEKTPVAVEQADTLHIGKGRILVMDDEPAVLHIITEMLNHLGYQVVQALNGDEALQLYQKHMKNGTYFDAVIMDLTVPGGMGGAETIKELLLLDPKAKGIVSSGYSNNPVMANYKKYGFCGVIQKPYLIRELSVTLQEVFPTSEP